MHRLKNIHSRLRALFSKDAVEHELDDELRFHLDMETEENVRRGMNREEARNTAFRSFGGVEQTKEACRDVRGVGFIETLVQDIRYASRTLEKHPGFTLSAVATLAIAIGANTAIFSVVNAVVLKPLPYPEPERLVRIMETRPGGGGSSTSEPNFLDFREHNRSFSDLAFIALPFRQLALLGDGEPERLTAMAVTGSFFSLLGINPISSRTFSPEDSRLGSGSRVIVLSHGAWQRRFGSDPRAVGTTLNLDGENWSVIGIMPPDFNFLIDVDAWIPFAPNPESDRGDHRLAAFGRLQDSVTLDQARADLSAIAAQLGKDFPETNEGYGVELISFPEWIIDPDITQVALILSLAVGLILLLACANVSNLLIARATARHREIGLRTALGAGRIRIVRQLLTESVLLAFIGAVAGLLIAYWTVPLIRTVSPYALPRLDEASVNGNVLVFTLIISVVTGIVFGLAPAFHLTNAGLYQALREGQQVSTGGTKRLRDALVVGELALAMMLLILAGLLAHSFYQLTRTDVGFDPENVLTVTISLSEERYPELASQTAAFYRAVLEQIETLPGVRSAGATIVNPFTDLEPKNRVGTETARDVKAFIPIHWRIVTPGFFRTLAVPLLEGRVFDETETVPGAAMINGSLAKRLWPEESPVGKRIQWDSPGGRVLTVIGVVGDITDTQLDVQSPPLVVYRLHQQAPWPAMAVLVKTEDDPESVAGAVRRAIWSVDDTVPLPEVKPLAQNLVDAVARPRFNVQLLGIFAATALMMAAMGIYGIVGYAVARRKREIGIRIAMGARPWSMAKMILTDGLRLIAIGVGLGALGSLGLARILGSLLYETDPTHWATFATVAALLLIVGTIAGTFPALRAARIDPIATLRAE